MKVIDATDAVVGRLSSKVAKLALEGEIIHIVNAEKAVISGKPKSIIKEFVEQLHKGHALKGPYTPRRADMILKRIIRGMLPYKKETGIKALKRIKTYLGIPSEFQGKQEVITESLLSNTKIINYITLEKLSKVVGGFE